MPCMTDEHEKSNEDQQIPAEQTTTALYKKKPISPANRDRRKKNFIVITTLAIVAIVIIGLFAASLGISDNDSNNDDLVTGTPGELALSLSDFPEGWQVSDLIDTFSSPDDIHVPYKDCTAFEFNTSGEYNESTPHAYVAIEIITFYSVGDAEEYYSLGYLNITSEFGNYVVNDTGNFDQCFKFEIGFLTFANVKCYVFQEQNVIGLLKFGTYLDYSMPQSWIDEMLTKQEVKINNL